MRARALFATLLLVAAGMAEGGAATPEALAAAEARLAEAGVAVAAAEESAALVAAIGGYEAALAGLRGVILDAAAEERALRLAIAGRREELMRLAATLQAMGRLPPPAPGLHPQGPGAAAQAAAILEQAAPGLRAEAMEAAGVLARLEAARAVQAEGMAAIARGLAGLDAARDALAARVPAAVPAPDPALTALVRESETLSALAAALAGPGGEAGPVPEGALAWPLAGRVLLGFNEPDGGRLRRPGIVLGAPGLSLVTAPADGSIRYAGPFLDFGYVVVLRTAPETTVVLAGLAEVMTATGAQVARGDLLGRLGGRSVSVEEYVMLPHAETGAGALETLYIEIRHGRGPVDPVSWFGSGNGWEDDR